MTSPNTRVGARDERSADGSAGDEAPRGLGGLLTTEVVYTDLGTYNGRQLRGRVERRQLRIALGSTRVLRLNLTRLRPVGIEVRTGSERWDVPIHAPRDPWIRTAQRLLLLWASSVALLQLTGRLTRGGRARNGHTRQQAAARVPHVPHQEHTHGRV